ncbi:MAG: hypothetical protein ABII79_05400 [bacterium]
MFLKLFDCREAREQLVTYELGIGNEDTGVLSEPVGRSGFDLWVFLDEYLQVHDVEAVMNELIEQYHPVVGVEKSYAELPLG